MARRFALRAWGLWTLLVLLLVVGAGLLQRTLSRSALEERARSLAAVAATLVQSAGETEGGSVQASLHPVVADPDVLLVEALDGEGRRVAGVRPGSELAAGDAPEGLTVTAPVPAGEAVAAVRLVVSTDRVAAGQVQAWLLAGLAGLVLLLLGLPAGRLAAASALAPVSRTSAPRGLRLDGPLGEALDGLRHEAEAATARALEAEAVLDRAMAHLPEALVLFDHRGRCVRSGPAPLPGAADDPVPVGMSAADAWKQAGAGDGGWATELVRTCLRTGDLVERSVEIPGPGGRSRHVSTRWVPVPLPDGGTAGVLLLAADVTARHRDRAELDEQADRLRRAERLEAVGHLTGAVAHDFNNLLTVVRGFCGLLAMRVPPESEEAADVEEIRMAADRGAALTARLLGFARASGEGEPDPLDPVEAAIRVESMLSKILGESSTVEIQVEGDPGAVRMDAVRFEQVLLNLASNARDAMPGGGAFRVRISDASGAGPEELASPLLGDAVVLSVSDTGTGMDQATAARVFDAFFTTKDEGKGTGLGLATVQEIVSEAGGFVELDTTPGMGTTFHLHLPTVAPVDREAAEEGDTDAGPAPARGDGERVVLVDDDEQLLRLMARVLRQRGYAVDEVSDPGEAASLLEAGPAPDLVVTDVAMPGLSGVELVRRLRADHPAVRVLFTSGYGDGVMEAHGVEELRGDGFLAKPFSPEALAWRVRELLLSPRS